MRNSDFDVYSAYGEVVDNSIQAGATEIKILIKFDSGGNRVEPIHSVAFGDDGCGMDQSILHRCLQLGYSSRFNDRSGIGRFGVGATLAAINQCKRVEIFSRVAGGQWLYTFFDLDDIKAQTMTGIPLPVQKEVPAQLRDLCGKDHGTLVIWSHYDRQPDGAQVIIGGFKTWVGRTYRKFIDAGVALYLNGSVVPAIDPLYVSLARTAFPNDPKAVEYKSMSIDWPISSEDAASSSAPKSKITIRMSLLPEEFRRGQGAGNSEMARERHIPENEGISILRNDREVFYDHIPHWPGEHFEEIDRWWGCEISFDAVLDRDFTVKNIKRGAVPARELKKALAQSINPTRKTAVEAVREIWAKAKTEKKKTAVEADVATGHEEAERAAKNTPTPKGPLDAGKNIDEESKKITEAWLKGEDERQKAAWEAKFKGQPFTILDAEWKGPEFVETNHLGGADVLRYNQRHPFFGELHEIEAAMKTSGEISQEANRLRLLIDLLLISHAKSESMIDPAARWTPEALLETLRMQWGTFLANYIKTTKKKDLEDE